MNTLEEVLALEDTAQKIQYLKNGRRSPLPDTKQNIEDWNPNLHEIMTDKKKYPPRKVLTKEETVITDPITNQQCISPAQYDDEDINRIVVAIEQDTVNIATAMDVGTEPTLECDPNNDDEKNLLSALKRVFTKNKLKYQNKKIVRSWLSEQEVCEYWYVAEDDSFWAKLWAFLKRDANKTPTKKLKSVLWSPFRGDNLYPFFDESGDLVAMSREYDKKDLDNNVIHCFMTVTIDSVYKWESGAEWKEYPVYKHPFSKLPCIYTSRDTPFCAKIRSMRVRLEKLMSEYADCIDYNFFPLLELIGDSVEFLGSRKNRMARMDEGADAKYLTWDQVPDTVKFEFDSLTDMIYDTLHIPRITFKNLSTGNAASGTSFRYRFMGSHMEVSNHEEDLGPFFQRRVNFLISALGDINTYDFAKASQTIDVETHLVPFMIDDIADKVKIAMEATGGKAIWSRKHGMIFVGNIDKQDEEKQEILEDEKEEAAINGPSDKKTPIEANIKQ